MLEEEYHRCKEALHALKAKIEQYPKGALNVRKKNTKEKNIHIIIWSHVKRARW